jgi:hypothetical protein
MSTANRNSRRETARQAAYSFLSNIALGSETNRSQAQNGGNDYFDTQAEPNRKPSLTSRSLEGDASQISDYPSTGIGTSFDGNSNIPTPNASKRGPDLKVDTNRHDENALDSMLRRQSPKYRTEEWSESPLDLRLKDAGQSGNGGRYPFEGNLA